MKNIRYGLMMLLLCGATATFGQGDNGAALFPELTPDVRGVGMGNSGVASSANAFSIWRNAAKNVFSDRKAEVAYSFTPWMRELASGSNLHALAGHYQLDDKQGIQAGFRYINRPEVERAGAVYTPKDWSIDLGYARKLTEGLSVGATARFVRSALFDNAVANGVAFDLGVYYQQAWRNNDDARWSLGLQASNFGTKMDYGYGKYKQPAKVNAGGGVDYAFNDNHRLQGTLEVGYRVWPGGCWESAVGAEYTAFKLFSVRGGYHYGEENNRMQRYGTIGCGAHYSMLRADFAFIIPEKNSFLKNTWQVSLGVAF